jgi:hypothetical protein
MVRSFFGGSQNIYRKAIFENMRYQLACIFWIFFPFLLQAQSEQKDSVTLKRAFRLVIDNDVFTSFERDQYYTSGLFGYFRKVKNNSLDKRKIHGFGISQRIYTPFKLSWENIDDFDRPYAGLVSIIFTQEWYSAKRYSGMTYEGGILGPASMTAPIHQSWHNILGLIYPEGWEYQIGNAAIINLHATHARSIMESSRLDVISESNLSLGTIYNQLRQEFVLRLGNIKSINQSVLYNGNLGTPILSNQQGLREFFLFFTPGLEVNIHNTTIEGRIWSSDLHTEQANTWIYQNKVGFMMSWQYFDLQVSHYWRTPETSESIPHSYVGIELNYRY